MTSDCVVLLAKEKHSGVLIGRGGATLKKMMRESGARIDVGKDPVLGRDPSLRDVRITGPQECVEYASCLVEEVLHTANLMDGEIEGSVQRVVELDGKLSMRLLAKAAAALKQIGKQTRTWIRSVKDEETSRRSFTIFGTSEEDVAEAQGLLESRAGVEGSEAQYTKTVPIRPDQVGGFIGRGGDRIMELQDRYGIRIRVPKDKEGELSKEDRHVSLSGDPDKVNAAFAAVTELLQQPPASSQDAKVASRKRPLPTEGLVQEKIFIDEIDLSYRRQLWASMEDGFPGDAELFVRGLPAECTEQQLYDHLCSLGLRDVQEILLLRRCGKSKRAAYVMFASHASALLARQRLDGAPASVLTQGRSGGCGGAAEGEKAERLAAWLSESERCAKGAHSVYRQSILGLLLGSKGNNVVSIKEESGAQEINLTGANMKSFGVVDDEPRLHLVVTYELGGPDGVCIGAEDPAKGSPAAKAARLWERQLRRLHAELGNKGQTQTHWQPSPVAHGPPAAAAAAGLRGPPPADATAGLPPTAQALGPSAM